MAISGVLLLVRFLSKLIIVSILATTTCLAYHPEFDDKVDEMRARVYGRNNGESLTSKIVEEETLAAETRARARANHLYKDAKERHENSNLQKIEVPSQATTPVLQPIIRPTMKEPVVEPIIKPTYEEPIVEPSAELNGAPFTASLPTRFAIEKRKRILPSELILLRFQPTYLPRRYTYRMRDIVHKEDWDGQGHHWKYENFKEYEITRNSVRPVNAATEAPDIHELVEKQTSGTLLYNGRPVERLLKPRVTKSFSNDLGETTGADGEPIPPTIAGRVVLPERDVAVGDTWQEFRPRKEEFPLEVLTKYKHLGYRRLRGRLCAVVQMNAFAQGHYPDENLSVDLRMKGRFYFSVEEGFVLRYERNSRIIRRTIKDKVDGAPRSENRHIYVYYRYKGR